MPRQQMIARYDIKEQGLKKLLKDLCLKQEDYGNFKIILRALRGDFSEFHSSSAEPASKLIKQLKKLGYADLAKNYGRYDHYYKPQLLDQSSGLQNSIHRMFRAVPASTTAADSLPQAPGGPQFNKIIF